MIGASKDTNASLRVLRGRSISVARVTAIGFAAGSALHAVAFLLIGLGIYLYGLDYPAWRHPVMASADAAIAWIAVRRPQWLILALATWVIEQTMVNGFGVLCALVTVAIVAEVVATRVTKRWPQRTQREKTL